MTLLNTYAYFQNRALETLWLLKQRQNDFAIENHVISSVKCYLLNNNNLNDFTIDGEIIDYYLEDDNYHLNYDGYNFTIEVKDNIVMSYLMK